MKIRLRSLLALSATAPLLLAGAACGSKTATEQSNSAPSDGSVATAPATSTVALSETGSTLLYPLFSEWGPAYHQQHPNVTISTQGTGSGAGIAQVGTAAQLIGAHAEVLGDLRHMLVGRIDDLLAENPRQGGLGHTGATVKLRGGDPVAVQQLS